MRTRLACRMRRRPTLQSKCTSKWGRLSLACRRLCLSWGTSFVSLLLISCGQRSSLGPSGAVTCLLSSHGLTTTILKQVHCSFEHQVAVRRQWLAHHCAGRRGFDGVGPSRASLTVLPAASPMCCTRAIWTRGSKRSWRTSGS